MFIEYAAEFAFNEGGNDGFWRFQLRGKNGRWIKMYGLCSFEFRIPGDSKVYRAYGTFQGNRSRGLSMIRVGEGEALAPGDYEIDSRFVSGEKAVIRSKDVIESEAQEPKKIDETVGEEAAAKQVIAATVGDLEVGDIVQQSTEAGLYGRIASVDHSGETTKLNVEWSDGTAFDMDLPKDQKIKVWNSQNADVPTTNGGLDWADNDDWYQKALDEYDENRALMNGDSNAPTDFVPGDNLLSEFEGSKFVPGVGFDDAAGLESGLQIVDYAGRKVVLADINGVKVPFYLSTGQGGKKDVASRKWYPFFGLEQSTGWLNKASGNYINDYYGSPELRAQAEWLDANIGDIMDDNTFPVVRAKDVEGFADIVNADTHPIRLDKDGLGNDKMDTLIKANIADIVERVRMDPDALQKKADEARARVDAVKQQIELVDAPKSDLKSEMDGEDALSIIRDAAAEVAAEDGRFPVARSAEDVEAAAKKQYAGVFEALKAENPGLVEEFKDFDEFWGYAKKNMAAGVSTRWADSVDEIPEITKAANRIYARDVLGLDPDGLITFYRNSVNGHGDVAKAAAGYASLDSRMAFNYNSDKGNQGANGRYAVKAKPDEVLGLLGYSDAVDEHGVVIGQDITSNPDRIERLGDLKWDALNPLMNPEDTNTGSGGGSGFRFFSTASSFDFPVLEANPFAEGADNKWSDFYAANGLEKGAIPAKYDELYGEGAFERDFPGSSGVPRYDIARDLFTEKSGQFALDPKKFDATFKGSNSDLQGRAGDGRDKALKFFEAIQGLSGQRFMTPRNNATVEEAQVVLPDGPKDLFAEPTDPAVIAKMKADAEAREAREAELDAERQSRQEEIRAAEAKAAEDYRMSHRPPTRGDSLEAGVAASLDQIDEVFPEDILDPKEQQKYHTGDAKADKEAFDVINAIQRDPDAEVTIYRGVPDGVDEIGKGDWVTLSPTYAQTHVDSNVPGGKVISKKVKASDLFTNADSIQEWGYDPLLDAPEIWEEYMPSAEARAEEVYKDILANGTTIEELAEANPDYQAMPESLRDDEGREWFAKELVYDLIIKWGGSSFGDDQIKMLQQVAANHFNPRSVSEIELTEKAKRLMEHEKAYAAILQSMHNVTQKFFADRGITELTIYRGDKRWGEGLTEITRIDGEVRPMSSWSADIFTAKAFGFGGVTMKTTVPVSQILSIPQTGLGVAAETELVLLGMPENVYGIANGHHGEALALLDFTPEPEPVDAPNVEEAPATGKRITERDFSAEDEFWKTDKSEKELKAGVAKEVSAAMREMGVTDEDFDNFIKHALDMGDGSGINPISFLEWDGLENSMQIKIWDGNIREFVDILHVVGEYIRQSNIREDVGEYVMARATNGEFEFTMADAKRLIDEINATGHNDGKYSMYSDLTSDMRAEVAVSTMVFDWAKSSNDAHPRSLLVQSLVENMFNIENASGWKDISPETMYQIEDYSDEFGNMYMTFIRAQYELTQKRFRDAGISEVVLYRGMNELSDSQVAGLDERSVTSVDIQSRPLSSWSTNSQVAYDFAIGYNGEYSDEKYRNGDADMGAALLMRQVVPIDRIFSTPFDGVGCYNEREVVLLGGESKVDAVAALGDQNMKSIMEQFDEAEEKKRVETRENPGAGGVIGRDNLGNPVYEEPKEVLGPGFENWNDSILSLTARVQDIDPDRGSLVQANFIEAAGFNGKPTLLSQSDFDGLDGETIYRAVGSTEQVEHYKESPTQFAGTGSFGNGTYSSNIKESTEYYAGDTNGDQDVIDSRTMEMKLLPDANVVSFDDATELRDWANSISDDFINQFSESGADFEDVQSVEFDLHNYSDWTNIAIMLGIDAIRFKVPMTEKDEYYTIILNRGKVAINDKS